MPTAHRYLARSLALCLCVSTGATSLAVASGTPAPAAAPPAPAATAAGPPGRRPRIGLVLGGGGAMGAAHIGVFKVLEELHVPVDCIAGTSMGALVGGAYATGMSAVEVEDFIRKIDWAGVFGGTEVRQSQSFMRKEQTNRYSNNLEFTVKDGGLSMPSAIVPTQEVESLIRQLVSDYRGVEDFDRLPIPFRSVATDLKSGKPVVFRNGELPVAMRASMSVPGVFSPVEVGDTLLADGGLVNNLPVDVARSTCADVVIAVDVDSPPPEEASMRSATGTFSRMLDLMVDNNEQAQWESLRPEDVGIHVLLETVGSGSFDKAPEAIPVGEASARAAIDSLRRYSMGAPEYDDWRASLRSNAPPHVPRTVGEIQVAGLRYTSPEYVKSLVDSRPGEPVNEKKIADDALRIFATGEFESVNYRFEGPAAAETVVFEPVERRDGATTLGFDFGLESATHGDVGMVLRADVRHRLDDAHGSHWRAAAQLGVSSLVSANYVRSLDVLRRSFADVGIHYQRDIEDYYAGDDLVVRYLEPESGVNLDLGHALGTWGEARAGMFAARQSVDIYVGLPLLPELKNYQDRGYRLKLTADTRDKNEWATRGFRLTTTLQASEPGLGADQAYTSLAAEFTISRQFRRNLWFFNTAGGTDFDTGMPVQNYFALGGPEALTALSRGQLRGPEFAFVQLGYGRELTKVLALFDQSLYGGLSIEGGNVWKRIDGSSEGGLLWGAHLFVGGRTPIGPVSLDFGYLETGDMAVFLRLGAPVFDRFQ